MVRLTPATLSVPGPFARQQRPYTSADPEQPKIRPCSITEGWLSPFEDGTAEEFNAESGLILLGDPTMPGVPYYADAMLWGIDDPDNVIRVVSFGQLNPEPGVTGIWKDFVVGLDGDYKDVAGMADGFSTGPQEDPIVEQAGVLYGIDNDD